MLQICRRTVYVDDRHGLHGGRIGKEHADQITILSTENLHEVAHKAYDVITAMFTLAIKSLRQTSETQDARRHNHECSGPLKSVSWVPMPARKNSCSDLISSDLIAAARDTRYLMRLWNRGCEHFVYKSLPK